eukprot:TRINITY_DN13209_c0_g1_i2.p1 TRINITY_DN13209_c0_g1~~TRINITY_DN13209_c0_g1_i2.p1  ORF type:complete len:158 (-),score=14.56 TRINITY_DN13209_c0_g1_i2:615-1088(-)
MLESPPMNLTKFEFFENPYRLTITMAERIALVSASLPKKTFGSPTAHARIKLSPAQIAKPKLAFPSEALKAASQNTLATLSLASLEKPQLDLGLMPTTDLRGGIYQTVTLGYMKMLPLPQVRPRYYTRMSCIEFRPTKSFTDDQKIFYLHESIPKPI